MEKSLVLNLENLDLKTKEEILNQLELLKNKLPKIFKNLEYVGIKENMGNSHASTEKTNKFIYLNLKYFSNRNEFLKLLKSDGDKGYFLENCDSIASIISHEFGHIIHNSYLLENEVYLIPIFKEGKKEFLSKNPNVGSIADIMGRLFDHGKFPEISAKYVLNQKNSIKRKREAFAESFSSIMHTEKSKWEPCVVFVNDFINYIENSQKYLLSKKNENSPSELEKYEIIKKELFNKFGIDLEKEYNFRLG